MELTNHVKELVAAKLKIAPTEIAMQTDFFTDLGADSLLLLSLITELESTYSVQVPSAEIQNFTCLENIVNFLSANRAVNN